VRVVLLSVGGLAVVVGIAGLVSSLFFPRTEPRPLQVRPAGQWYDSFTVDIPDPGRYAIWATRPTEAPDAERCQVSAGDGSPTATGSPALTVKWIEVATDDTLWTWIADFEAPQPARYAFSCRLDAGSPGQQYTVTAKPGAGLTLSLLAQRYRGLAVAVLVAGVVILLSAGLRRRRPAID
jgi:hypothetical protein